MCCSHSSRCVWCVCVMSETHSCRSVHALHSPVTVPVLCRPSGGVRASEGAAQPVWEVCALLPIIMHPPSSLTQLSKLLPVLVSEGQTKPILRFTFCLKVLTVYNRWCVPKTENSAETTTRGARDVSVDMSRHRHKSTCHVTYTSSVICAQGCG